MQLLRFAIVVASILAGASGGSAASLPFKRADLAGYLIAHFSPTDESIFLSLSDGSDPLSFTTLNGGDAYLTPTAAGGTGGARDPYLFVEPDRSKSFILATDLKIGATNFDQAQRTGSRSVYIWTSSYLVNWSADSLVQLEDETAGMVWAPSAAFNGDDGKHYVFWSSRFFDENDTDHTGNATANVIRYASTDDFQTFSAPQTWTSGPGGVSIIDQEIQYIPGTSSWTRFLKDESVNQVFQERSDNGLFGDWYRVGGSSDYVVADNPREGPTAFQDINDSSKWHLFLDDYAQSNGAGGYVSYESTNILTPGSFAQSGSLSPNDMRHGQVIAVTSEEYNALAAKK